MRILFWDKFCCYCGKKINYTSKDYTKEHLVPKSKGGNNLSINKKTCCKTCNNWRGNQSLSQFKSIVKFHINSGLGFKDLNILDLNTMIENIEYWEHYIKTSNNKLKK